MRYVFADCELDTALYVLQRHGCAIRLRPKVYQVLLYLLEHRAEVVSKDALIEAMWPNQYISEATLADAIRSIRQAVGDDSRRPRVIRTRHGHGYHFIAEVTVAAETSSLEAWPQTSPVTHVARLPLENQSFATGERKIVSALYGSLGHTATLLELFGLDAFHSLMRHRYDLVRSIVQQYGGMIQSLQGDRVLAVFGVPMTHEDHAQRAALAALAVRDGLQVHQQTGDPRCHEALAVRLGLHTGQIAVEEMGSTPELTARMVGDVVALAITFQEHAEPGTILCSQATAQRLQEVAEIERPVPIPHPEQSRPVPAYTLLALRRRPTSRDWTRPPSPFVGRKRELAALEARLAALSQVFIFRRSGMNEPR